MCNSGLCFSLCRIFNLFVSVVCFHSLSSWSSTGTSTMSLSPPKLWWTASDHWLSMLTQHVTKCYHLELRQFTNGVGRWGGSGVLTWNFLTLFQFCDVSCGHIKEDHEEPRSVQGTACYNIHQQPLVIFLCVFYFFYFASNCIGKKYLFMGFFLYKRTSCFQAS